MASADRAPGRAHPNDTPKGLFTATLVALLVLLCLALCAGCSSKNPDPGQGDPGQENPGDTALPPFRAGDGQYVHVNVTGGDDAFNEDLASLVTASLQSDCGLQPAYTEGEADILVDVHVKDVSLAGVGERKIEGGRALANTAMGTSLGLAVGSIAGYRRGALIGAGLGAALGLGVTMADADSESVWQLSADVTMKRRGGKGKTVPYLKTAKGVNMQRDDAVFALKNSLSQDIAKAIR